MTEHDENEECLDRKGVEALLLKEAENNDIAFYLDYDESRGGRSDYSQIVHEAGSTAQSCTSQSDLLQRRGAKEEEILQREADCVYSNVATAYNPKQLGQYLEHNVFHSSDAKYGTGEELSCQKKQERAALLCNTIGMHEDACLDAALEGIEKRAGEKWHERGLPSYQDASHETPLTPTSAPDQTPHAEASLTKISR